MITRSLKGSIALAAVLLEPRVHEVLRLGVAPKALLEASAGQGNQTAVSNLGKMYLDGMGVPANARKAVKLFQAGSTLGNAASQTNLAICYCEGKGVAKDPRRAAERRSVRQPPWPR